MHAPKGLVAPHAERAPTPCGLTRRRYTLVALFAIAAGTQCFAGSPPGLQTPTSPLSVSPHTWAVECAANEVLLIQHPDTYLRYRYHVVDEKGDQLRDQIETPEGSVARLIERDGHPVTPDEDAAERERLQSLLDAPSAFARHIAREQVNKKMGADQLKLMPDAMIWTYAPGQPQLPGKVSPTAGTNQSADGSLIVLDFSPDPKWSPPSLTSEPLTGLRGRVWIDPRAKEVVRLDAELFHAVNIGFGMLAHIYPGGSVTLSQSPAPTIDASRQRWIVQHIVEQFNLKALMVKNVRQRLVFDTASYQAVPAMTYQQAIRLLLSTPAAPTPVR